MNSGVEVPRKVWSPDLTELKIHRREVSDIEDRIHQNFTRQSKTQGQRYTVMRECDEGVYGRQD